MTIWENGVIREMTPEEERRHLEMMESLTYEDDPYDIIDVLTGEKQ